MLMSWTPARLPPVSEPFLKPARCDRELMDVLDALEIAGTPESGGWTSRELRRIIQSLHGLNVVAFDIVELSPAYDTNGTLPSPKA
jgi:hypothetical protein